jgi:hypothetical protein
MAQTPRPVADDNDDIGAAETVQTDEESERDEGPRLEPVGTVRRELISPTGQKVLVDVPIYPPFRLEAGRPEKKLPRRPGKTHRPRKNESGSGS